MSFADLLGRHDDLSSHLRMYPAIKRIFSGLSEAKLELVVGVQCCRLELPLSAVDGVWHVIMVDPCYCRPHLNGERYRTVHKVIDYHLRRCIIPCSPHKRARVILMLCV